MTSVNINVYGRGGLTLSTTGNENNISQTDIHNMLARINALEERVDELERNQKDCSCSSSSISPKQVQEPLFGPQQSLFGPKQSLFPGFGPK